MVRQLLQEQPQQATSCQQLGGISSGGWIALSLLAGILAGVAGTLLFQCYRRRKQLKYMATAPTVSQYYRSAASLQPPVLPHQSAAAAQPAQQQQKYFSPLSKSLSAGTSGLLHAVQLAQGGTRSSSLRMTDAGDINSRGMHDQRSTTDVHAHTLPMQMSANNPFAAQEVAAGGRQLQAQVPHTQLHPAAVGWGSHMEMQQNPYPSTGTRMQAPQQASSPDSSTGPDTEYQLPASTIPQALSSPAASSPSDAYPAPRAHAVPGSSSTTHSVAPHTHAAAHSAHTASVSPPVRPGSVAAAGGSRPSGDSSGMRAEASTASTAAELEDEYAEEDLDEDWKSLLSDVDARLLAQGAHVMTDRERAVAIKKLLVATGTRGVDFAMAATLQEVLRFRKFHGSS